MNNHSELNRQKYREILFQFLISEGHTKDKAGELTDKFDQLTDGGMSADGSFGIIYGAYGSCDARMVLNHAARFIRDNLEDYSKVAPKVTLNSKNRLADLISRFNKNVQHLASIEINGVSLTTDEIAKLKLPIPASESFTASASDNSGKVKSLTLEITI